MSKLSGSVDELRKNDRQWDAFTTDGHCIVLAPPGSGKTKLLTTRLAYDLVNKIERPQGAACITFTNAAADELRRRVEHLGVENRLALFVGTVHGFALRRIVTRFARLVGRPDLENITIATKQQCDQIYDYAISSYFSAKDSRYVKSTIVRNRQRMATNAEWARHGDRLLHAHLLFERELKNRGLHDFLSVIELAVKFVEQHKAIRTVLTAEYPHLYIDEYQDLSPGLDRLVKALCFDHITNSELFAVGDPDQSIMAFTGARPELLHALAGRTDVARVELEHNYRCGQGIIQLANRMRQGRPAITGDRLGGDASAIHCPEGLDEQYSSIVTSVQAAQQRGVPLHEIGVLAPHNDQCRRIVDFLRAAQVPAFFRDADGTYRPTPLTGFIEGCASWATLGREQSHYRLSELLRRWRTALGQRWTIDDDAALVDMLMKYREKSDTSALAFLTELRNVGLDAALREGTLADEAMEVKRMAKALDDGDLSGLSVKGLAERARRFDRVEVTTMTSSKSLEFDVVMLVSADEDYMPDWRAKRDPSPTALAEERRKFYVSITRARNELRISYSGFVLKPWGEEARLGPSRYLREIELI
ncbi:ATP-dependent helicase [Actinosynnema sp. CA-299493]